jgi:MtN3 and saliva related transmembrane protein
MISLLPQIVKSWKTKSTKDISLGRYCIYSIGLLLWIVYGWLIGSWPLIIMLGIEFVLALTTLRLKLKYG